MYISKGLFDCNMLHLKVGKAGGLKWKSMSAAVSFYEHILYMIHVDATEAFLNLILHFFSKGKGTI